MNNRRFISSIIELVIGSALIIFGSVKAIDSFWTGMGASLIIVSILQLIRQIRYKADKKYKEDVDVVSKDERNRFISTKAWSWAGYIFVIICAVATIVLKIAGQDALMMLTSGSICVLIALYWISYWILNRKY